MPQGSQEIELVRRVLLTASLGLGLVVLVLAAPRNEWWDPTRNDTSGARDGELLKGSSSAPMSVDCGPWRHISTVSIPTRMRVSSAA